MSWQMHGASKTETVFGMSLSLACRLLLPMDMELQHKSYAVNVERAKHVSEPTHSGLLLKLTSPAVTYS